MASPASLSPHPLPFPLVTSRALHKLLPACRSPTVLVPIATGSEEIESSTIIDVLRRVGADVTVASASEEKTVTMAHGMKFVADIMVSQYNDNYDAIVFPGGMPGTENLRNCLLLKYITLSCQKRGKVIAAICAAPAVVLVPWGVVNDQSYATCYPHPGLTENIPLLADGDVVVSDSGNLITGTGPATAMKFALRVAECLLGPEIAGDESAALLVKS